LRYKSLAIDRHAGWQFRSRQLRERGKEIADIDKAFRDLARGDGGGPTGEARDQRAAFQHGRLMTGKNLPADGRTLIERSRGAVVTGKNNQRVFTELQALEFGDQFANEFVKVSDVILVPT